MREYAFEYKEIIITELILKTLSFLTFIRTHILSHLHLSDLLDSDSTLPENPTQDSETVPETTSLIRNIIPVVKFEELRRIATSTDQLPENCVVCLYEFEERDEVRWLTKCKHVYHRTCFDRWIDLNHWTCPLCRDAIVPDELQGLFDQRHWVFDFYNSH